MSMLILHVCHVPFDHHVPLDLLRRLQMLLASGRCFAIPSDRRRCGGSRHTLCEDGGSHEPPSHGTNGTRMMIFFVIIDPLELGHLKKNQTNYPLII